MSAVSRISMNVAFADLLVLVRSRAGAGNRRAVVVPGSPGHAGAVGAENPVMAVDLASHGETELAVWLREHHSFGHCQHS